MELEEVRRLNELRLERDWSYRELADDMGFPEKTIHRILTTRNVRLYQRTLFKIRRYLERTPPQRRREAAAAR